jgi:hypothetical protein
MTLYDIENVTVAHIHGALGAFASTGGVLTAITYGNYTNGQFVLEGDDCALVTTGNAYVNVHTTQNALGTCRVRFPATRLCVGAPYVCVRLCVVLSV